MKEFTKLVFGKKSLPKNALLLGGDSFPRKEIKKILALFDSAQKICESQPILSYEVKRKNKKYLLCFGAYGGTRTLEIINLLTGGGVKNIYFLGWAATYKMIDIATVNIPKKVRALDGICRLDSKNLKFAKPSKELLSSISIRNSFSGTHCTIPALGVLHGIHHIDREAENYETIDTELSVVLHFAKKQNINAIGILIITDSPKNHKESINPDINFNKKGRYETLRQTLTDLLC